MKESIENLPSEDTVNVTNLLKKYQHVFAKDDFDLGLFRGEIKHKIDTGNAKPIRQKLRRTLLGFESEEEKHIDQMLEKGIIQPSLSEWASPPVLVRKKDGKLRFCIDFRALNKVTVKDAFPLPNIKSSIDTLKGSVFFSTLDMAQGYWNVLVDEKDRHKTAFVTKYGLFEHIRLPFGLCNSPATFSRIIQYVLRGLNWKECLAYLDDVVVLGENFHEHLNNLSEILSRFEEYNLKLKPKKCHLFKREIKFLGKIVNAEGISIDPENTDTVREWPTPQNTKQIESFLGFANDHRDHIPRFAEIAKPLHEAVKESKKKHFHWTKEYEQAFQKLKTAIMNALTLSYPSSNHTFILDTDASNDCIGAELSQVQNGKIHIISFASKVLSPAQRKYCTTRKELLAVITFTRQFRHFLLGKNFIVRTDHNSLVWLMNFKNINGQLARWLEELSQYEMTIQHRSGKLHKNADSLSRVPHQVEPCNCYQSGVELYQLPCGGCKYCSKIKEQWQTFEEEVDYVIPLAIRSVQESEVSDYQAYDFSNMCDTDRLRKLQSKDKDLAKLKRWVDSNYEPSQQELSLSNPSVKYFWSIKSQLRNKDGILFYKWEDPVKPRYLFVAPNEMYGEIISQCHDNRLSGHLGQNKTLEKVKQCAIWHGMKQTVKNYVESCPECNKNKKPNVKSKSSLGQYHAGAPMQRVHMDILGPLPVTKMGNKYILMIIDQFTKWVECHPLPDQNAETVVKKKLVNEFLQDLAVP